MEERYYALLRQAALDAAPARERAAAAALARDCLALDMAPEELADMHQRALARLALEQPDLRLSQVAPGLLAPLTAGALDYPLAFRQQLLRHYAASNECPPCAFKAGNLRRAQLRRLDAVGTLASGIAHDINTILGVIHGHAELLGDQAGSEAAGHAREIIGASLRARDLILRMLTFSGQQAVAPVALDAVALIRQSLETLRPTLPPGINLRFEAPLVEAWMMADPAQIEQILFNLCHNAVDAMAGRGCLAIELARAPAEPGADAPRVLLLVVDDGCGMPPEVRQRVFDAFYTTKEPGRGSGLGLSVVYGIVSDLRGAIRIDSAPGAGSRFYIELPFIEQGRAGATLKDYRKHVFKIKKESPWHTF